MDKKQTQLGMNPSTASQRLVKDILFSKIVQSGEDSCYRCGLKMERSNFSIEHKEAWLDSKDPVGLFFGLDNIAFSHLKCNIGAARKVNKEQDRAAYYARKRAEGTERMRLAYSAEKRREKYRRTGH